MTAPGAASSPGTPAYPSAANLDDILDGGMGSREGLPTPPHPHPSSGAGPASGDDQSRAPESGSPQGASWGAKGMAGASGWGTAGAATLVGSGPSSKQAELGQNRGVGGGDGREGLAGHGAVGVTSGISGVGGTGSGEPGGSGKVQQVEMSLRAAGVANDRSERETQAIEAGGAGGAGESGGGEEAYHTKYAHQQAGMVSGTASGAGAGAAAFVSVMGPAADSAATSEEVQGDQPPRSAALDSSTSGAKETASLGPPGSSSDFSSATIANHPATGLGSGNPAGGDNDQRKTADSSSVPEMGSPPPPIPPSGTDTDDASTPGKSPSSLSSRAGTGAVTGAGSPSTSGWRSPSSRIPSAPLTPPSVPNAAAQLPAALGPGRNPSSLTSSPAGVKAGAITPSRGGVIVTPLAGLGGQWVKAAGASGHSPGGDGSGSARPDAGVASPVDNGEAGGGMSRKWRLPSAHPSDLSHGSSGSGGAAYDVSSSGARGAGGGALGPQWQPPSAYPSDLSRGGSSGSGGHRDAGGSSSSGFRGGGGAGGALGPQWHPPSAHPSDLSPRNFLGSPSAADATGGKVRHTTSGMGRGKTKSLTIRTITPCLEHVRGLCGPRWSLRYL